MRFLLPALLLSAPAFGQFLFGVTNVPSGNHFHGHSLEFIDDVLWAGAPLHFGSGIGRIDRFSTSSGDYIDSITGPGNEPGFGNAMVRQGDTLVVTAVHEKVFIYDLNDMSAPQVTITNPGTANNWFGHRVAISGNRIAVGAHANNSFRGAVWVYDLAGNLLQNMQGTSGGDFLGSQVAMDGDFLFISEGVNSETVHVRNMQTFATSLLPVPGSASPTANFGAALNVADGMLMVTANNNFHSGSGTVYVFDTATQALLSECNNPYFTSSWGYVNYLRNGNLHVYNSGRLIAYDPATGAVVSDEIVTMGGSGVGMAVSDRFFAGSNGGNPVAIAVHETATVNSFCPGEANSWGQNGKLEGMGSTTVSDNTFGLFVSQIPWQESTLLLNSPAQGFVTNPGGSQGNLCLSGGIGRHKAQLQPTTNNAKLYFHIDMNALPRPNGQPPITAIQPGDTWCFQAWYRDGSDTNFTEAIEVTFN